MNFLSIYAIIAFPFIVLLTRLIPSRFKAGWLLVASFAFYGAVHPYLAAALLCCCVMSYGFGLAIERLRENERTCAAVLFAGIICHVLILLLAKYGIVVLPGSSFFLLQGIGYMIDVFRGKMRAERNPLYVALFIAFFPNILSGPIERAGRMIRQFKDMGKMKAADFKQLREGFYTLLWGYFLKLVVAERCAVIVNTVYGSYYEQGGYAGGVMQLAVVLYSIQIYLDFAGSSCIAVGAARMLGIRLVENFKQPYLVSGITEFWRHWHISLSEWFKDYVYIPLGGSRKGGVRHSLNLMIVFAVSGFWHGADMTFVAWGMLHGVYQVAGSRLLSLSKQRRLRTPPPLRGTSTLRYGRRRTDVPRTSCAPQEGRRGKWKGGERSAEAGRAVAEPVEALAGMILSFVLVTFAWIFFRADSFAHAMFIIKECVFFPAWMQGGEVLYSLGLEKADLWLLLIGIALVTHVDIAAKKGVCIREKLGESAAPVRVVLVAAALTFVAVTGYWGGGYDAGAFIYIMF